MEINKLDVVEEKFQPQEKEQTKLILIERDVPCCDLWPGLAIEREFTITVAKNE
jgi:hypothetical protein